MKGRRAELELGWKKVLEEDSGDGDRCYLM